MEENNNQQQPAKRRIRRKFRWGRLLCLLLFAGLLGTALFFGTCWIYNNFINPPHVSVTAADDKIRDDQKLNERICWELMMVTAKRRKASLSVQMRLFC